MFDSKTSKLTLVTFLLICGAVSSILADYIPPLFITPGSYQSLNPDGTHPYGESHGMEIGVDVEFSHIEDCLAIFTTRSWRRPLTGGAKVYSDTEGEIQHDYCENEEWAFLMSGSASGLTGVLVDNGDGSFTADYTEQGGNERVWHPIDN